MAYPEAFMEELRSRMPVSAIVGRHVRLIRRGREQVGLCPFHQEKTPSFTVNDDKGFYHCFGCGAHGDAIGFLMAAEGLAFPEAVEALAALAGLNVPEQNAEDRHRAEQRRGLLEVLEAACSQYERLLRLPVGRTAMDYLEQRGLTAESMARFRLGYAPPEAGVLTAALKRQGFDQPLLTEAGLLKIPEDGRNAYDFFRNRIIFPITDRRGQIIAFGGRILGQGQPKYLNSPESALFHKGRTLYGLAQARRAAHDTGELLVVEGYMDVISLNQGGFPAAVAPLGTALTETQIVTLWRLAAEPILCLDGDTAGQRAALRAAERALPGLQPGHSLRFATLPEGEDPDSLLRRYGAVALRERLETARPLIDILFDAEVAAGPIDTPERQADLQKRLLDRITTITDATIRANYGRALSERLLDRFGLILPGHRPARSERPDPWTPGRRAGRPRKSRGRWQGRNREQEPGGVWELSGRGVASGIGTIRQRGEQLFLATLINHPELLDEVDEALGLMDLTDPALDRLRREILEQAATREVLTRETLCQALEQQGEGALLAQLLGAGTLTLAAFARPEAPLEQARTGLADLLAHFGRAALEQQLLEAEAACERDLNDETLARVMALTEALRGLGESGPAEGVDREAP